MKLAYSAIALFAAFVASTVSTLWNVTPDRQGLTLAAAFVVLVASAVILALAALGRRLKKERRRSAV